MKGLRKLSLGLGLFAGGALLLGGCLPYGVVQRPAPPVDIPSGFAASATVAAQEASQGAGGESPARAPRGDGRWWRAFGDPQLDALIASAMENNFQIRAAWARVDQMEQVGRTIDSARWPQLSAQLDLSRRRQLFGPQVFEINSFGASLPVSYELDLWNRVGAQVTAAGLDYLATRDDLETMAMSVAANVVEQWLNARQQGALRELLEAQLQINETYLELVQLRFSQGLVSALDVHQQRQQVARTRAQLAQVRGQEQIALNQLSVLVGRPPGSVDPPSGGGMPEPPPLPEVGLPIHLILRRPDLRAARRRLEAADWRVGAAVADRLPTLRFSATLGLQSTSLETFFESFIYSFGGSLLAPLFDGFRREAAEQQARAVVRERLETFGQSMLTAMMEVENSILLEHYQRQNIAEQEEQLEAARASLRESLARYRAGLIEYLPVLSALQAVQGSEQSLLASERQLLSFRVQLHRALGGTWTVDLEAPEGLREARPETLEIPAEISEESSTQESEQ